MIDFKPSQVYIGVPPLTATMGKSEAEHAAAIVVRVCQARGDEWQSVTGKDMADVLRVDMADKREPFASLIRNPFFRPLPAELAALGFCTFVDNVVTLTEAGLEALRPWVRHDGVHS